MLSEDFGMCYDSLITLYIFGKGREGKFAAVSSREKRIISRRPRQVVKVSIPLTERLIIIRLGSARTIRVWTKHLRKGAQPRCREDQPVGHDEIDRALV